MYFYQVFLKGVKDCYTWHSDTKINIGSRVLVSFRNRKKIGIIISEEKKIPTFKTLPVIEIYKNWGLDSKYIELVKELAPKYFVSISKFLSLLIPEEFLQKKDPVKREVFYILNQVPEKIRSEKQKIVINTLQKNTTVSAKTLKEIVSTAVLNGLEKKGVIEKVAGEISYSDANKFLGENFLLTTEQKRVFESLKKTKKPSLIWGVTGSGKTEIYKKISKFLIEKNDGQLLFLLPEIALTPQLIGQFKATFGNQVSVWHSNLSRGEKIQEWARIQTGQSKILIGTRSSVLIPIPKLKGIIIDEEHEWTFKNEFAPRYWTHDICEKLAKKFNAKLVLGSATPRLQSLKKCTDGDWQLEKLFEQVHKTQPPKFEFVDLTQEAKKGNFSPLSENLVKQIKTTLEKKEQVVLFLNKRGYAGSTMCKKCGHYFECKNCSANMKMHNNTRIAKLICHTCGYLEKFPNNCPECKARDFLFRGWGTQQVEAALKEQIPTAKVLRADADSVTGKYDFERLLENFHASRANILLGTQMIAKGLDFELVTLVGIILADVGLGLPDFQSQERVFQLLSQVSGRAGRRKTRGKIILQTFHLQEKIFSYLRNNAFEDFYKWQLKEREKFLLPPFASIAKITFSMTDKKEVFKLTKTIFEVLKDSIEKNKTRITINFAPAFFPRSHNKYHFHIFLSATSETILKDFLRSQSLPDFAKIDINPSSLL